MRLIDADEIKKEAVPHTRGDFGYSADIRKWAVLVGDIDDAPTIEAEPVIYCKYCKHSCEKHYMKYDSKIGLHTEYRCARFCDIFQDEVHDNFFCGYGDR